ncbi:MAG: hypothetical protein JRI68_15335 [Deltaproteobacteria bacterium]|nr:hypothetical protein [Deltaproteobacteria bacterium]
MSRNFYLGVGSAAALLLSMACTTTDDTGDGGGGSTSTSTGTGGTTSGTGGGGGTTSGTGGGGGCASCFGMMDDEDVTYEDMCTESAALWDALELCVCGDGSGTSGACETECAEECGLGTGGGGGAGTGGAGGAPMTCASCQSNQCSTDWNACTADN